MKKQTLMIMCALVVAVVIIGILAGSAIARNWRRNHLSELIAQSVQQAAQEETERMPMPTATPNAAGMANMLKGELFAYKLSAARLLGARSDIPIKKRVQMLVEAISAEVVTPTTGVTVQNSYLEAGQVLRLILVRSLSELGDTAISDLRQAVQNADGVTREHLLVALVYLGDKDSLLEVRDLVTGSSDPVVRMDAARALGIVKDQQAIPMLVEALQDDFLVNAQDSLGAFSAYPVREQAAGALDLLGVKVTRISDGSFTVGE
jgi:HEAT repeat protein